MVKLALGEVITLASVIVAAVVGVLQVAIPLVVPPKERPPIERRLVAQDYAPVDVMSAVNAFGDLSITVKLGNQTLTNLLLYTVTIKNAGAGSIVPEDIYDRITLDVPAPWKILYVTTTKPVSSGGDRGLNW